MDENNLLRLLRGWFQIANSEKSIEELGILNLSLASPPMVHPWSPQNVPFLQSPGSLPEMTWRLACDLNASPCLELR